LHFSGERTWGVLTKLDLMDKGTDAVDVRLSLHGYYFVKFCSLLQSIRYAGIEAVMDI
jgi:hypothetical protein